jgi:hypothetical protein
MDFLYEECQNTGVAFRFGQEIKRIEKSMRGQLQAVDIGSSKPGNVNETNVSCHNIIVAAGAQTPEALDDIITWLEPKSTFENHTQIYEWVRAPLGESFDGSELEDVSLIIRNDNNLAGKGKGKANSSSFLSSHSFSILTAEPETNTILAATLSEPASTQQQFTPTPGASTKQPKKQPFTEAQKLARTHLKDGKTAIPARKPHDSSDNDNEPPKSSTLHLAGSARISTAFSHSPLVSMIPWQIVDPRVKDTVKDDDESDGTGTGTAKNTLDRLGIYVAYGLGRFGTTLAPGVARMVAAKVYSGGKGGKGGKDVKDDRGDAGVLEAVGENYGWPEGFDE